MDEDSVRVLLIEPDAAEVARWRQRLGPRFALTVLASPGESVADGHDVAVLRLPALPEDLAWLPRPAAVVVVAAAGDAARRHPLVRDGQADYLLSGELEGELPARVLSQAARRGRLEAKLEQARRMQAVGHLARGLAHEFNNLLTGIIGYTELLQHGGATEEMLEMALPEIVKAAQRLGVLTQQMRAYGRRQMVRPGPFDLNGTLRELRGDLGRLLGPDVRLALDLAPDLPPVKGDPTVVETILLELLQNSREAMEGDGAVTLATRAEQLAAPLPTSDCLPGPYVVLTVRDTGRGLTDDAARQAFDPFFTTRVSAAGSGLGLTVVRGLVRQMNGFVTINGLPGQGATVAIHWPAPVLVASG